MRRFFCTLMLFAAVSCTVAQESCVNRRNVKDAVERMLADYPESTLQDIYKSFFQDRFGPGHIVPDSAKAASYLQRELSMAGDTCVLLYEPTGEKGNYVRVALAAISCGKVPFDKYLSCFLRSVREVKTVEVAEWAVEWAQVENIIAELNLGLPGYSEDAAAIKEMLAAGHYAVHHSREYNKHYSPHYRIMSREIFEAEILPLLHIAKER